MAKLKLNGVEIEAAEGAPLVEVIKQNGVWISNLCYIDGLPPYAGCRSWVELDTALPTDDAVPVLDDTAFAAVRRDLDRVLEPTAFA